MTFNNASWGYMPAAAHDAWSARDILKMLNTCAGSQGNLLLNIGPAPDGSVPEEAVKRLPKIGNWLGKYGEAFYGPAGSTVTRCGFVPVRNRIWARRCCASRCSMERST